MTLEMGRDSYALASKAPLPLTSPQTAAEVEERTSRPYAHGTPAEAPVEAPEVNDAGWEWAEESERRMFEEAQELLKADAENYWEWLNKVEQQRNEEKDYGFGSEG